MGALPEALAFPMTDVRAAAAFLTGLPAPQGVAFHNLIADQPIAPAPQGMARLAPEDWLRTAPLPEPVRRLIAADPLILRADARFDNAAAKAAWTASIAQGLGHGFDAISDARALLARRLGYQTVPALT